MLAKARSWNAPQNEFSCHSRSFPIGLRKPGIFGEGHRLPQRRSDPAAESVLEIPVRFVLFPPTLGLVALWTLAVKVGIHNRVYRQVHRFHDPGYRGRVLEVAPVGQEVEFPCPGVVRDTATWMLFVLDVERNGPETLLHRPIVDVTVAMGKIVSVRFCFAQGPESMIRRASTSQKMPTICCP
jgi:hypothetical protein